MALNFVQILRLATLMRTRGSSLSQQGAAIVRLLDEAPLDLSSLLGPVLLIAQGYAKAQAEALSYIMQSGSPTPDFWSLPLDRQGSLQHFSVLWTQLRGTLGSLAFSRRLPTLSAITHPTPEGRRFGANATGVALATRLEALTNVTGVAGLSFETFWSLSATARTALGRLAATDLALATAYDFDPIQEVEALLREGVPLVPDVDTLLQRIETEKVPHYRESPVARTQLTTIPDQTSIQAMAQIMLGDAGRWTELVAFNSLRAPYISADPIDQLGALQGALTLLAPSGVSASTITVAEITTVYLDQRLRFDTGVETFLRSVVAVDKTTQVVTLDHPLEVFVPTTTLVWIYSPAYDVVGKVLQPGETMLIPTRLQVSGNRGARAPEVAGISHVDQVYGVDVEVDALGHLLTVEGDLTRLRGIPNVVQALRHRLVVPRGSVIHRPRYGCGLHTILGRLASPYIEFFCMVEARQTLLRDPRIARVTDLTAVQEGDALLITFTGVTQADEQFPATTIPVGVR